MRSGRKRTNVVPTLAVVSTTICSIYFLSPNKFTKHTRNLLFYNIYTVVHYRIMVFSGAENA